MIIVKTDNKVKRSHCGYIPGLVVIIITGIVNILGFFKLPDEISMQFTAGGLSENKYPAPFYLAVSFILILILSLLYMRETVKEQKIKWMLCDLLVGVLNIIMIAVQLP